MDEKGRAMIGVRRRFRAVCSRADSRLQWVLCLITLLLSFCIVLASLPIPFWQWWVIGASCLMVALSPLVPSLSMAGYELLFLIAIFLPHSESGSLLYLGLWLITGIFSYATPWKRSIWVMPTIAALLLANTYINFDPMHRSLFNVSIMFAMNSIPYLLGLFIRMHHNDDQLILAGHRARYERQLRRQTEDRLRYSQLIHDSTMSELSCILLIAQRHVDTTSTQYDDRDDWSSVLQYSQSALHGTREAITIMSGAAEQPKHGTSPNATLHHLVEQNKVMLHNHGINGTIHVSGALPHMSDSVYQEIIAFTKELFANILRYAEPDEGYDLVISIDMDNISFSQTNTIALAPRGFSSSPHMGMTLHANNIKALNGQLRINNANGIWILYASIPLQGGTTTRAN